MASGRDPVLADDTGHHDPAVLTQRGPGKVNGVSGVSKVSALPQGRVDEVLEQVGLLTAADARIHGAAGVEPVRGRDRQEPVVNVVGEAERGEVLSQMGHRALCPLPAAANVPAAAVLIQALGHDLGGRPQPHGLQPLAKGRVGCPARTLQARDLTVAELLHHRHPDCSPPDFRPLTTRWHHLQHPPDRQAPR